ncbi:MAG: YjjG family noncanonical pyrimidine nucleotidase [Flavobacteriales bacterium]|nr:YjjG family noncanonical pyrimidine nucleotidase [Flavobacteriales bacterium]
MTYKNIKNIFFDLDHTLWDFEKNSEEALSEIIAKCQKNCEFNFSLEEFLDVYKPLNELMWKLYRENKISKEDLRIRRFSDALKELGVVNLKSAQFIADEYVRISPRKTNLFPHAMDALDYLSKKYKLHIITNGFEEIQFTKLKMSNIEVFFDEVITSEAIGVKKPDPIIFEFALEKAGALAHESIMVGDNYEADILGALSAKIPAIYFNMDQKFEMHENVKQITNLRQLMEIF